MIKEAFRSYLKREVQAIVREGIQPTISMDVMELAGFSARIRESRASAFLGQGRFDVQALDAKSFESWLSAINYRLRYRVGEDGYVTIYW